MYRLGCVWWCGLPGCCCAEAALSGVCCPLPSHGQNCTLSGGGTSTQQQPFPQHTARLQHTASTHQSIATQPMTTLVLPASWLSPHNQIIATQYCNTQLQYCNTQLQYCNTQLQHCNRRPKYCITSDTILDTATHRYNTKTHSFNTAYINTVIS